MRRARGSLFPSVQHPSSLSLQKDSNICISVRNPLSDYETREKVVFGLTETVEQEENSREPPCQFALKWEGSKKRSTLEVLHDPKAALKKKKYKGEQPRNYITEDSGNWVPILVVECRGMEPFAFHALGDEFIVESEGGVRFD